jgi:hypothetical protein
MLLEDLPRDLPSFQARFGTDAQCRDHLFHARWPAGFRCAGCDHDRCHAHKLRLIYECAACGKQHSLLAGTIFEQSKTGLARWFLAIFLVTSSKGGISAMELQRQLGFRSYGTAGSTRSAARWSGRDASPWRCGSRPTRRWSAAPDPASPAAALRARRWSRAPLRVAAARRGAGGSAGCGCRRCPTPRPRASRASSVGQAGGNHHRRLVRL